MFEKLKVNSLKYKTSELPDTKNEQFCLPALTAGIQNQGLNNYVPKKNATILKNAISISANGANTGATFYQKEEFTVLQDAYAINWTSTNNLNDKHYLFLVSAINKTIFGNFEWTNKAGWEKVKKEKIQLPTKNDEIDFDFMESFIDTLEKERIEKVDAYLTVSGLQDVHLTNEEKEVLGKFENDEVQWGEFKMDNIFEISNTLSFNQDKLVQGDGYDYVTRTSLNQGVFNQTGFVNAKNLNSAHNWSLGLMQMDFFYRRKPWYAGQFVRKITPKIELTDNLVHFLTTSLNTLKPKLLTIIVRKVDNYFLNKFIKLPTKNNEPDYRTMELLISALKKQIMKGVVDYTEDKMK